MILVILLPILWTQVDALGVIPDFLRWGSCADVVPQKNFQYEKFEGIWYTQEEVPNDFTSAKKCLAMEYHWEDPVMYALVKGIDGTNRVTEESSQMTLKMKDGKTPIFYVKPKDNDEAPFIIFETDYTSYSCAYSCLSYFGFKAEFIWIYTRNSSVSDLSWRRCHEALSDHHISTSRLKRVYHGKNCLKTEQVNNTTSYDRTIKHKNISPMHLIHDAASSASFQIKTTFQTWLLFCYFIYSTG